MQFEQFAASTRVSTAEAAILSARKNDARQWSSGPDSARTRLTSGSRMSVTHKPKFSISNSNAIFTMGSCFAREIERALLENNIPLLLENHGVSPEKFEKFNEEKESGGGVKIGQLSRAVFHKYTTHSMLFDIDRAFNGTKWPDDGLLELYPDQWFDPHAAGLNLTTKNDALENRAAVDAGMREINRADVVIITLGLTESWREKKNGLIMNRAPRGSHLAKNKNLFEFIDFGYDDVILVLRKLVDLIIEKRGAKVRILVTVSPVPSTTFTIRDVVEASVGSKSILRAAAETVSRLYRNVDYFPSYEMVMMSPRELAWFGDQAHVQTNMVRSITDNFIKTYYREPGEKIEMVAPDEETAPQAAANTNAEKPKRWNPSALLRAVRSWR